MTEIEFITTFLAENAGYAREKFATRGDLTVTSKTSPTDLLTEVDLTLQHRAIEKIREHFPDDQIVAEEGEFSTFPKDPHARCWVMDPIDGTSNFVKGIFPVYAISLAFAEKGIPQVGGVCLPDMDMTFLAERDKGATMNGKPCRVSQIQTLDASRIDVDFSTLKDRQTILSRASNIITSIGQIRCHGSAVCSIIQIATGDVEAYLHMSLNPWDYAAAQLIVEESGGVATRLDNSPLELFDGREGLLITNGAIHSDVLCCIK